MIRRFRQLPFEYAFRNLGRSPLRLGALLLGSALVVVLILASAGFVRGMQLTLTQHSALHENVILLGAGSEEALERSQIATSVETIAAASISGLKETGGVRYVSPEIHMALPIREQAGDERELQTVMRGVQKIALLVHPEVEIVEGRFPHSGEDELMLGALVATRLGLPAERIAVGRTLHFDHRDWTIVGRFQAPNTVMDAEIWLTSTDLQIATKREASVSSVVVTLDTARFADVDFFAKSRLDLEITAMRESDYYSSIAAFYRPIRIMIMTTALLITLGAVLGGLNTMYASFVARVREVGMMQSLGYRRVAIMVSLVEESVFVSAIGTLIGASVGYLLLDGAAVRFSMGAFAITLDASVMLIGILSGLGVGLVGAIPPAVRCLRMPITDALKSF